MADNLYDYLNRFNLGQLGAAGNRLVQGAANTLNRYGVGQPGGLTFLRGGGGIQQRPIVNPEFMRPDYSGAGERARRLQEYQTGRDIPGANTDYSVRLGGGSPGASQGGGFGGGGQYQGASSFAPIDPYAAQNREYERERARVEAMVKANPDMQKQAIADERAKVRDQGMAIWAAKYGGPGGLASKVKPGAVGYDAIQRGIGIQSIPSIENRAEFSWNQATQGPTPAVPMADAMLNPSSPGFIGGEGPPPVNFADPRFENMSPEEFQKLLNQYTKR